MPVKQTADFLLLAHDLGFPIKEYVWLNQITLMAVQVRLYPTIRFVQIVYQPRPTHLNSRLSFFNMAWVCTQRHNNYPLLHRLTDFDWSSLDKP
jgi:hypothetical protein